MKDRGQAGPLGIIVLAVGIIIGAYLIGTIYETTESTLEIASVTNAMSDTLDNSMTGLTLMAVAIIVGAAMFILGIMGSR